MVKAFHNRLQYLISFAKGKRDTCPKKTLMRTITLILVFIANLNILCSQNLIPNGSFEQSTNLVHEAPPFDFEFLDFWYPANFFPNDPDYGGTPDLFDVNNLWPESNPAHFWNIAYGAASGNFHAGIANFATHQGYFRPEAVGTPLTESLEAGIYYHIELRARNKGVANNFEMEPLLCVVDPHKQIDIYLGSGCSCLRVFWLMLKRTMPPNHQTL